MKKTKMLNNPAVAFQNAIQKFISLSIAKGYLTESQAIEVLEAFHNEIRMAGKKE